MVTEESLRAFVKSELGVNIDGVGLDDPLISSHVIDSFLLVDLVMHIESTAGIKITPMEVSFDNLDTLGRMLKFVESKTAAGGKA